MYFFITIWFLPAEGSDDVQGPYYASGEDMATLDIKQRANYSPAEVGPIVGRWITRQRIYEIKIEKTK